MTCPVTGAVTGNLRGMSETAVSRRSTILKQQWRAVFFESDEQSVAGAGERRREPGDARSFGGEPLSQAGADGIVQGSSLILRQRGRQEHFLSVHRTVVYDRLRRVLSQIG